MSYINLIEHHCRSTFATECPIAHAAMPQENFIWKNSTKKGSKKESERKQKGIRKETEKKQKGNRKASERKQKGIRKETERNQRGIRKETERKQKGIRKGNIYKTIDYRLKTITRETARARGKGRMLRILGNKYGKGFV